MTTTPLPSTISWQAHEADINAALIDAFQHHAIDNRGQLNSTRQAEPIATTFNTTVTAYLTDGNSRLINETAVSFAEQGMAITTATALCAALHNQPWLQTYPATDQTILLQKIADFQTKFLQQFSQAHEVVLMSTHETTQEAMQRALHGQLTNQQTLREIQERQNQRLNTILTLNAELATISDEQMLLDTAVSGICIALDLDDITIFKWRPRDQKWLLRTTTAPHLNSGQPTPPDLADLLDQALANNGEHIQTTTTPDTDTTTTTAAFILYSGDLLQGGLILNNKDTSPDDDYLIPLRTFAQGLTALWRNIHLFTETTQRARELEILQGRYIDTLWQDPEASLTATIANQQLDIQRQHIPTTDQSHETAVQPLQIGTQKIGEAHLPTKNLSPEAKEYADALLREMSSALNNAHLLQTTRAFSNQLNLAADVSRAATTILDRDLLIQEVVKLIRDRFNLYYVGLFLVDSAQKTAVLQAGTGEAGKQQVASNHHQIIGGPSMIGTAIATNRARIENDVTQAEAFSFNPLLPDTRSELALPLRSRSRVIGALTVQATTTGAFGRETVTVLQSLVDQLAVAIENAELFAQTQQTLAKTSQLFQTSRRLSEARDPQDIYDALVQFARLHGGVDVAQVITTNANDATFLHSAAVWFRQPENAVAAIADIPASQMLYSDQLEQNNSVVVNHDQNDLPADSIAQTIFNQSTIRSVALLPIHGEGEWLGTLILHTSREQPWQDEDLQPFRTLAGQAGIILSNQNLLHQTETLYRIGRTLSETLTREDALEITVAEVASYLGALQCRVVFYDKKKNRGHIAAELTPTEVGETAVFTADDAIYHILNEQRQPLILQNTTSAIPAEALNTHMLQFSAKTTLLVPATKQHELSGYLAIDSDSGAKMFTSANIIFAQTIVDQLFIQIENVKLLDDALNRAQEMITLNQIQTQISGVLNKEQMVIALHREIGRLLPNSTFTIATYDSETRWYEPLLTIYERTPITREGYRLTTEEPLYHFMQKATAVHVKQDHPLMQEDAIGVGRPPLTTSLWVPLMRDKEPVGVLSVHTNSPRGYTDNDIQLLRSIATHTNLALANAELFAAIQAHIEEISAANDKLRQLDQLKSQFLANMSHELRTPLNSIIGFSRIILKGIDGPITKEQEEDLSSVYNNGQHLLRLINDLLDMAKIEAGKMSLIFEETDIAEAAKMALSTIRSLMPTGVQLESFIEPDLPKIEADQMRMRQIFINLLSNATKFTEEGYIRLQITSPAPELIHIVVADTGIGIESKDYDKLFARFEQVDNSNTRSVGGTGLGLPITRWLVNMHHGRIWVDSELGAGTEFHIMLPIQQPTESDSNFGANDNDTSLDLLS